jgi:hypothetical protein
MPIAIFFVSPAILRRDNPVGLSGGGFLTNPLTRKLENFVPLSSEDRRFLAELARRPNIVSKR